jgi:hypothetical protein
LGLTVVREIATRCEIAGVGTAAAGGLGDAVRFCSLCWALWVGLGLVEVCVEVRVLLPEFFCVGRGGLAGARRLPCRSCRMVFKVAVGAVSPRWRVGS